MGRRDDLEGGIRESYALIKEHEAIVRTSDRPEEKMRSRRAIDEQWTLIGGYLEEYRALAGAVMPEDIRQIAARFIVPQLSDGSDEVQTAAVSPAPSYTTVGPSDLGMQVTSGPLDFQMLLSLYGQEFRKQLRELEAKFTSDLYVSRSVVEAQFAEFIGQTTRNCFLLLGRSGVGKTNILCHLAEECSRTAPVVFLRGTMPVDRAGAILERILEPLGRMAGPSGSILDALGRLEQCLASQDAYLYVFIDGINETLEAKRLKEEIRATLLRCYGLHVRFCLSCRDLFWSHFDDEFWGQYVFSTGEEMRPSGQAGSQAGSSPSTNRSETRTGDGSSRDSSSVSLHFGVLVDDFSDSELERAAEMYFSRYGITAVLEGGARDRCCHPLMLRFFSESNPGRNLGTCTEIGFVDLVGRYWNRKVSSVRQRVEHLTDIEIEAIILAITGGMFEKRRPFLEADELREVAVAHGTSVEGPVFAALFDEGIVFQELFDATTGQRRFGFYYDEVLEYSLARFLLSERDWIMGGDDVLLRNATSLVKASESFYNIVGASEYLVLIIERRHTRPRHFKLLERWSKAGTPWRLMVAHCITRLDEATIPQAYGILKQLMVDLKARVRQAAAWALGQVGKRDQDNAFKIIEEMAQTGPLLGRDTLPFALTELAGADLERSTRLLERLAEDREPYVRRVVAWSMTDLAAISPEKAMKLLNRLVLDDDWWVRRAVADTVGNTLALDSAGSIALLERLVLDRRVFVRRAAAHSLSGAGKSDPDGLLGILKRWAASDNAQLRTITGLALRELALTRSSEALTLLQTLSTDRDPEVREAVAYSLVFASSNAAPGAFSVLLEMVDDRSHRVRAQIARLVHALSPAEAIPVIEALGRHPLRCPWNEAFASGRPWLAKSLAAIARLSFVEFAVSSNRLKNELGFHSRHVDAVNTCLVDSLEHCLDRQPERGANIVEHLACHEDDELRKVVAVVLTETARLPSRLHDLAENLQRDRANAVRVAVRKSAFLARRQRNTRKTLMLNSVLGAGFCAGIMLVIWLVAGRVGLPAGAARQAVLAPLSLMILSLCTAMSTLGLFRVLEGFGTGHVIGGWLIGAMAAIALLLTGKDPRLTLLCLFAMPILAGFIYDYVLYYDHQLHFAIAYYSVIAILVGLCALIISTIVSLAGWREVWIYLLLAALCGMATGLLHNLNEDNCWKALLEACSEGLPLGVGFVAMHAIFAPQLAVVLRSIIGPSGDGGVTLFVTDILLGLTAVPLGTTLVMAMYGERYREAISRGVLPGTVLGLVVGLLLSRDLGIMCLAGMAGCAAGGLTALVCTSARYRWQGTIQSTLLMLLVAGPTLGFVYAALAYAGVRSGPNLLFGALAGVAAVLPVEVALYTFSIGLNEFTRLD